MNFRKQTFFIKNKGEKFIVLTETQDRLYRLFWMSLFIGIKRAREEINTPFFSGKDFQNFSIINSTAFWQEFSIILSFSNGKHPHVESVHSIKSRHWRPHRWDPTTNWPHHEDNNKKVTLCFVVFYLAEYIKYLL